MDNDDLKALSELIGCVFEVIVIFTVIIVGWHFIAKYW